MSDTMDLGQQPDAAAPEPEKKEEKRRGAIWWWLAGILAIAGLAGGGAYYYAKLKKNATPVRAVTPSKVDHAYFFRIDGQDSQGRPASFDFIILTNEYTWVKGSTTEVVSHDAVIPEAETAERVLTPAIRDSLANASDLIAVGLASREGDREQEEQRALDRAQTIATWLAKAGTLGTPLWTLTLGQFDKTCELQGTADTSFERPLILSGVRSKAEGVSLQEALADALQSRNNLPKRSCYTRFEMTKVQ